MTTKKYFILLSIAILFLGFSSLFLVYPENIVYGQTTKTWTTDPMGIKDFVNTKGFSLPASAAMYYDQNTAKKVCELAGYNTVVSMDCKFYSNLSPSGRCGFHSPHDNTLARWDGSSFTVFNASQDNKFISSLTCGDPIRPPVCNTNSDCGTNGYTGSPFCQGNNVYQNFITYTCQNPGTSNAQCVSNTTAQLKQTCSNGCSNGVCQEYSCTYNSYLKCDGNYLYWYDSCGNRQSLAQYCPNGCFGNYCINQNPYGQCTNHAYKLCVGNNVYWYDSCGNMQDLFQSCSGINMTCSFGMCVPYWQPSPAPINPYIVQYTVKCYGNNLYWYDSLGIASQPYRSCSDSNSCTIDSCTGGKCSNTLKCDGSTCAIGSADYNKYCATNILKPEQLDQAILSVSFFVKEDNTSFQWQKSVQVKADSQVYFMISLANNSSIRIDNVIVSANIPEEIASLGNLQVNGVPLSGNIVSGVNIGSLDPATTKMVTFEGKTYGISSDSLKQATATVNILSNTSSDYVSIALKAGQQTAAISSNASASGLWAFIKRWYLWILVGFVLLFLFIVVFRKLSSNT